MAKSRRARMKAKARKLSKARAATCQDFKAERSGLVARNRTLESDAAGTANATAALANPKPTPLLAHSAFKPPSPTTTHIAVQENSDVSLSWSKDADVQASENPFNPKIYKCTGYSKEPWEWFDGTPGQDSRFTIDIENGSTDGLRDVRPYLYLLGFWTPLSAQQRRSLEKDDTTMVEEAYVKLGRAYLIKEREMDQGYFLARRNWAEYNTNVNISFPFQEFAGCTPRDGDVGFEMNHEYNAILDDCADGVVKTNLRSPLPKERLVNYRPEDPEWDAFIRWIYGPEIHGAMWSVERCNGLEIRKHRATHGCYPLPWLKDIALDGWYAFEPAL